MSFVSIEDSHLSIVVDLFSSIPSSPLKFRPISGVCTLFSDSALSWWLAQIIEVLKIRDVSVGF